MIKLFTLEDLSAFSADAVYKICLALDGYGFSEEDRQSFEGVDALLTAASFAVEDGDDVVLAAENDGYLALKAKLLEKLQLEPASVPSIAERIAQKHSGEDGIDMRAQCLVPKGSVTHLTEDGLFSGFTAAVQNGSLTLMPLDFSRIDAVLESFVDLLFAPHDDIPAQPQQDMQLLVTDEAGDSDLLSPVMRLVETLQGNERRLGLALGAATQQILALQGSVEHLSEAVDFIDVTPDPEAPVDPNESQTAKVLREAKQAREDAGADYGAAVSPVYEVETEEGTQYYAFAAVADSEGGKAKKVNTLNPDDVSLLPGHCLTVLCDTVCRKIDGDRTLSELGADDDKKGKKLSKGVIAFAAIILLAAVLTPILLLNHFLHNGETTTDPSASLTDPSGYSSTVPTSETTLPADNYVPAEPGATEVSAAPTTTVAPSTSGTFTFYVFGYGHGVGLSQHGAEYLSSLGWTYDQILANYYYGTTLVKGDTYPAMINYAGTDYETVEYLASCLETEMSSAFSHEALKAQAVALYTFAKYNNFRLNADANAHGKTPSDICRQVAQEVKNEGLYIAYQGKTALTPFHSISAGKTTSYYNVWGGSNLPYLNGGRPSYGDYNVSNFKSTYTISSTEFQAIVRQKLGIDLSGDPATWITIQSHDQAISSDIGYVSKMTVGTRELTGNEFRGKVMEGKIRSHCFVLVYTPDSQPADTISTTPADGATTNNYTFPATTTTAPTFR